MDAYLLLKDDRADRSVVLPRLREEDDEWQRIRCPLCAWHPSPGSQWSCQGARAPEPDFVGCGTVWNTFLTRGRCPGCAHQWRWTSCLRCGGWSLHEDWYERSPTD
jgi:hypothetical protein